MMTDKERVKNLQKALGVIRKGVSDFRENARKDNNTDRVAHSSEILQMIERVINIYA